MKVAHAASLLVVVAGCRAEPTESARPAVPAPVAAVPAAPIVPPRPAAAPGGAREIAQDPASRAARLAAVTQEHDAAMNAWYVLLDDVKSDEDYQRVVAVHPPPDTRPWFERANALVGEDPTDDTAYQAIVWLLANDRARDARAPWFAALEKYHFDRPELGPLAARMDAGSDPRARAFVAKLAESSPHAEVRGQALFALADAAQQEAELARMLDSADENERKHAEESHARGAITATAEDARQRAVALYERVANEYGSVALGSGPRATTLGARAQASLFELRNLALGKTAPEIEGEDLAGVPFKLSDYRGKVVLLDFWGNW